MYHVVCFSHLRWGFVHQRPQHLLSRCARRRKVLFVEEPVIDDTRSPHLESSCGGWGVEVLTPHLPSAAPEAHDAAVAEMIEQAVQARGMHRYVSWFYTPMALPAAVRLNPSATVYDCMDELSAFRGAPPELVPRERALFERADLVFTGGHTLYEAKRHQHPNVHAFPSSVDVGHFLAARLPGPDPADQALIPGPRLGFFGVIDERMDLALLQAVARARPDYHFVLLGPLAKIDASDLPRRNNIHYLGQKSYQELPSYLRGWDVALMPFARNEATRFISPTKTPEYLAAGKSVVSTSIRDVVRTFGSAGLASIADSPEDFAAACDRAIAEKASKERIRRADAFLASTSWDDTWRSMERLIDAVIETKETTRHDSHIRLVAANTRLEEAAGAE